MLARCAGVALLVACLLTPTSGTSLRRGDGDDSKVLEPIKATLGHAHPPNDPRDPDFTGDTHVPPPKPPNCDGSSPCEEKKPADQLNDAKLGIVVAKQEGDKVRIVRVKQEAATPTTANGMTPADIMADAALAESMPEDAHMFGADGGGVTKGFCKGMLKAIEAKEAPYYLEGKFTGESRNTLVSQCGLQICGWAMEYATKVSACSECPTDCSNPLLFAKNLLASDNFEKLLKGLSLTADQAAAGANPTAAHAHAAQAQAIQAATGPSPNDPRDPHFDAHKMEVRKCPTPPCGDEGPAASQGEIKVPEWGATGMAVDPKASPKNQKTAVKGGVTKGFCTTMLKAIEGKEAPYFVEGKFTGETRDDLVSQCSLQVCDWAVSFGKITQECPQCPSNCDTPMTPEAMKAFVRDVLTRLEKQQSA